MQRLRTPSPRLRSLSLAALRSGYVIVGSLPTTDGTAATAGAGCLIVLSSWAKVVETFSGHNINGPWDMTAVDGDYVAALFVTKVRNGTVAANGSVLDRGTVVRLVLFMPPNRRPQIVDDTFIAKGFPERIDPAVLVIGPTGVAFDFNSGILYMADSLNNRIAAFPDALFRGLPSNGGYTVTQNGGLNDPLGIALTLDGRRLVSANGGDGNLVEIHTATGRQTSETLIDNTAGRFPEPARSSASMPQRTASSSSMTPPTPSTCFTNRTRKLRCC